MPATREQVKAFVAGEPVPDDVRAEIEEMRDEPGSLLWSIAEEIAEKTRAAFDPDSPPFGVHHGEERLPLEGPPQSFARVSARRATTFVRHHPWISTSIALAAMLLIATSLIFLGVGQDSAVVIRDGDRHIRVSNGSVSGLTDFSQTQRDHIKQLLVSRQFVTPKEVNLLTQNIRQSRVRSRPYRAFESPVNTVIRARRPTFRWHSSPARAVAFRLTITGDERVITSPDVEGTEWQLGRDLQRGQIYSWTFDALLADGRIQSAPESQVPPPKLSVLGEQELRRLEAEERVIGRSRLALSMLYVRYGLLDDAERELQSLLKENSDSDIIRDLLDNLDQMRIGNR